MTDSKHMSSMKRTVYSAVLPKIGEERREHVLPNFVEREDSTVSDLRDRTVKYDQLIEVQDHMTLRFTSLEEQLQSLVAQPKQTMQEEQTQVQTTEDQHLREIEQRYQQRIADLEAQLAAYQQKGKQLSVSSTSKAKRKKTQAKKLPTSLASRSAFAQLHDIPDGTVASACSSGKIASVSGTWLYKNRTIHQALSERGKHDFYQVFHTRSDFKPCKECPHEHPA